MNATFITRAEFAWRRLTLRMIAVQNKATADAVVYQMMNQSHRVGRRACLHHKKFWRPHENVHVHQMICDQRKGGCGAIISWVRKSETQERKKKTSVKPLKKRIEDQQAGEAGETSATNLDTCIRCGHPYQRIQTNWGQTVLCCSRWFNTEENCKIMRPLPGELLPEGEIRWSPPTSGNGPPPVSGAAAASTDRINVSSTVPTISTLPPNHLSGQPLVFPEGPGGPSPSGYGRFENPPIQAGRGSHRTLPNFLTGQLPQNISRPSINLMTPPVSGSQGNRAENQAAEAYQLRMMQNQVLLQNQVATLQAQLLQVRGEQPPVEETPPLTEGWTFAATPPPSQGDEDML